MPDLRLIKSRRAEAAAAPRHARRLRRADARHPAARLHGDHRSSTAAHPLKNDPAGGLAGFTDSLQIVSLMVFLVGAIVGATAGAQDLDTGVFRDLAATGRSRTALFLSRVGGAWVVVGALAAAHARGRRRRRVPARRRHPHAARRATSSRARAMLLASGAVGAALAVGTRRARRLARPGDRDPARHAPDLRAAAPGRGLPRRRPPGAADLGDQPHRRPGRRPRLLARARHVDRRRRSPGSWPRWPPGPGARRRGRSRLAAAPVLRFRRGCASRPRGRRTSR